MTDATTSEMRRTQVSVFAYFVHTESDGEERRDGDQVTSKQASREDLESRDMFVLRACEQTSDTKGVLVLDDDDDEEDADHLDWESWTTWKFAMQSSRVPSPPAPATIARVRSVVKDFPSLNRSKPCWKEPQREEKNLCRMN
ncbi:hypothetical protein CSIM01_10367 [Colletotrichum simmondsii]|uniref:Uncharacterized protein n=1 Tax=Colletotrichum simmondsii TaxID=703756 RepID=A0A135TAZ2_9PEZI|nr:hypothetical protein CSIM01_10367 [Colletotrichum simmondsii]